MLEAIMLQANLKHFMLSFSHCHEEGLRESGDMFQRTGKSFENVCHKTSFNIFQTLGFMNIASNCIGYDTTLRWK